MTVFEEDYHWVVMVACPKSKLKLMKTVEYDAVAIHFCDSNIHNELKSQTLWLRVLKMLFEVISSDFDPWKGIHCYQLVVLLGSTDSKEKPIPSHSPAHCPGVIAHTMEYEPGDVEFGGGLLGPPEEPIRDNEADTWKSLERSALDASGDVVSHVLREGKVDDGGGSVSEGVSDEWTVGCGGEDDDGMATAEEEMG
ncbi:hypothetical protein FH972_000831 [Carpinus fangiana]|uniref:Uncharacterized protein n=1 Tax=Carpinus fangiana TaxID=176857 RepID=A0A5N6Q9X1_9ROSI|nr:hypothetical protein FH972_000831 [Carpinus fangiana]